MRPIIKLAFVIQLRNIVLRRRTFSSFARLRDLHQLLRSRNHLSDVNGFEFEFPSVGRTSRFVHHVADSDRLTSLEDVESATDVHIIIKNHRERPIEEIQRTLDKCGIVLEDGLILNVLKRNRFDWKPAYILFKLLCLRGDHSFDPAVYNEILDILGKMRRFEEFRQVLDEMSNRKIVSDGKTYGVLLNRYAAAHKVEEAIKVYERRNDFGWENDLVAFQGLLTWLCRYKHVEAAETLFCSKRNELGVDIKTMNIILNGWCVLGNVHEAKRFWKDIVASKCRPDLFTYGTFINALTKKGKLGTAKKLFRAMWETGRNPDVIICNNVIDALCFKKRIPEALEVFKEMNERKCSPNVATYNSLVKHMCKIRRMEKVYELVDEMEQKGGSCLPNHVTFGCLLNAAKKPEEVKAILQRMEKNGCKMTSDLYNLIFKLYVDWRLDELVRETWVEMEKTGLGPDQKTYTVMVHGLYRNGKIKDALRYYREMVSKGMVPEPRTEILVDKMQAEGQHKTDRKEEELTVG